MEAAHSALVWKVDDPEGLGRVQLIFPSSGDVSFQPWAPVLQPYYTAAPDNVPEIGDEVLVIFLNGQRTRPVVVGRLPTAQNPGPRFSAPMDDDGVAGRDGTEDSGSRVTRLPRGRPRLRSVDTPEG